MSRGVVQDHVIIDLVRNFFLHSDSQNINHIDAIGFVVQAAQVRLTITQQYIFDSILSVFGKDIKQNVVLLITFADGQKPAVIDAVKAASVPCNDDVFKFNNSGLFSGSRCVEEDDFDRMCWKMGEKNLNNFFTKVDKLNPTSLTLTKEVLIERQCLEITVKGIQKLINVGICKVAELEKEQKTLGTI